MLVIIQTDDIKSIGCAPDFQSIQQNLLFLFLAQLTQFYCDYPSNKARTQLEIILTIMSEVLSHEASQVNIRLDDSLKSCRICLLEAYQHQQGQQLDFIAPCNCCGSLQFVHHRCLLRWMNTVVLRNLKSGKSTPIIKCEVCMKEYQAKKQILWQLSTCQKMKAIYKENFNNKLILVASILLILICLGSLSLFTYLVQVDKEKIESEEEQLIGYIVAYILVGGAQIAWIVILLKTYIIKRIEYFTKVYGKEQKSPKEKISQKIQKNTHKEVDQSLPGLQINLE